MHISPDLDKSAFKMLSDEEKLWMIYFCVSDLHTRVEALEKKVWFWKGLCFLGGMCGGFIGFFTSRFWSENPN